LIERKYDSGHKVETIYRVLVPALVLPVEDIIELRPNAQVFRGFKFKTRV